MSVTMCCVRNRPGCPRTSSLSSSTFPTAPKCWPWQHRRTCLCDLLYTSFCKHKQWQRCLHSGLPSSLCSKWVRTVTISRSRRSRTASIESNGPVLAIVLHTNSWPAAFYNLWKTEMTDDWHRPKATAANYAAIYIARSNWHVDPRCSSSYRHTTALISHTRPSPRSP